MPFGFGIGLISTDNIADGAVTNAKVNAAAAIEDSKLASPVATHAADTSTHGVTVVDGTVERDAAVAVHAALTATHGVAIVDGVAERNAAVAVHAALTATHGVAIVDGVAERNAAVAVHAAVAISIHGFDASGNAPPQTHTDTQHTAKTISNPAYALDTVYQNTSGRPKLVIVSVYRTAGTQQGCRFLTDAANPPTQDMVFPLCEVNTYVGKGTLIGIVESNHYYKVTSEGQTMTVTRWKEYVMT